MRDVGAGLATWMAMGLAVLSWQAGPATAEERQVPFRLEIRLLSGMLRYEVAGRLHERMDPLAQAYGLRLEGSGTGMRIAIESNGVLHGGRWTPRRTRTEFSLYGRQYWADVGYDLEARRVAYRSYSETFFLRRPRRTDDQLALNPDVHVDDMASAALNYAETRWPIGDDQRYVTHVVRRSGKPRTGPNGVPAYRAELRRLTLEPEEARPGSSAARFDLTGFSSWARKSEPAHLVFDGARRLKEIRFRLRYSTTVNVWFPDGGPDR